MRSFRLILHRIPISALRPSSSKIGNKKMKKTTTYEQFEVMVNYLEQHPQMIGMGLGASNSRLSKKQLWDGLTKILNQHGPPTRNCREWKNIWADYKYNIKRKLSLDFKFAKRTNPEKRLSFRGIEGRVINMLKLKEKFCNKQYKINQKPPRRRKITSSEKGKAARKIVKPRLAKEEEIQPMLICPDPNILDGGCEIMNDFNSPELQAPLNPEETLDEEQYKSEGVRCDVTLMLKDTLQGMQKTQLDILRELEEYNRLKRDTLYFKEQQLQLERDKFEEQKKQNVEVNMRASIELELKRRELELYEIKLKGSCTDCTVKTENVECVFDGS